MKKQLLKVQQNMQWGKNVQKSYFPRKYARTVSKSVSESNSVCQLYHHKSVTAFLLNPEITFKALHCSSDRRLKAS